jgi:ATP-grasp ribosomal peptide maturase
MGNNRPVLVVTQPEDNTADVVITELRKRAIAVVRLDPADFPRSLSVSARLGTAGGWHGPLRTESREVDLSQVRSLYYRRPRPFTFPEMDEQTRRFAGTQAQHGLGGLLASLPGCRYVSHPQAITAAEFKPAQLRLAVEVGLAVPETLITNDYQKAVAFAEAVGPVVYKPFRDTRYQIDGSPATIWTEQVDPATFDKSINHTAHLFQARVNKVADLRVTVIGDRMFCVRIDGGLLDWRRDYDRLTYSIFDPPIDLRATLLDYLAYFGLAFGAFDFALDANGALWFLECNPNGQWLWLEPATGLPMTAAMADLLEEENTGGC